MSAFWIIVSASAGTLYGEIRSATSWESDGELDRAGKFRFSMPASDSKAALVASKRIATCYTIINSAVVAVGSGVIDEIRIAADSQGKMMLDVSGDDRLRELTYRQVGSLVIDDGSGGVDTSGPADIIALAPAGWSLDVVNGYNATAKSILHTFEGELVLNAFVKLAELTGEHFRLGAGQTLIWMQDDQADSGVRAVGNGDPIALRGQTDICLITDIEEVADTYEKCSRIYPFGAGEGAARVVIDAGTSWGPVAGYTMVTADGYIKHDANDAATRIDRYVSFKDIQDDDMLAEAAYEWLSRRVGDDKFYRLSLASLNTTLNPGSTIRVVYHRWVDGYHAVDIDDDLIILSVTNRCDNKGLRTVGLTCGTIDRHPDTDASATVAGMAQAGNYYTHPQPIDGGDVTGTVPPGAHNLSSHTADYLKLGAAGALTIASNAVTKTLSFHKVDTSGGASEDLNTISGGAEGDLLIIRAANDARTVVAKDGVGNLALAGDCSLDNVQDTLTLIFDGTNWIELSRSDNGA